jgi:hypothetical protein
MLSLQLTFEFETLLQNSFEEKNAKYSLKMPKIKTRCSKTQEEAMEVDELPFKILELPIEVRKKAYCHYENEFIHRPFFPHRFSLISSSSCQLPIFQRSGK